MLNGQLPFCGGAAPDMAGTPHPGLIQALGVAVYTTDAEGRLTSYNEAAATLWGWYPPIGDTHWCGSWRLFTPNGTPLPHADCPMAVALREGRPVRGTEAIAERPDGIRVPFIPYPTPLRDAAGILVGAVNVLVDITDRKAAETDLARSEARLRAVFETTPECIKLVAPDGTLLQINAAGLRMIEAASPAEVEGRCVLDLVAPEHRASWQAMHDRVCHGEALRWEFDIIGLHGARRRMETDATPLRLPDGQFAQLAITRDVTSRKRAEDRQAMLALEVDHRAKNALQVALSLVRLTRVDDPRHFAAAIEGRIAALAHAHTLLAAEGWTGAQLREIAEAELAPYRMAGRVDLHGPSVWLVPGAVQPLSMMLHELRSNAAKFGALSVSGGVVELTWTTTPANGGLELHWVERGGPPVGATPRRRGFGLKLLEATARDQLGGALRLHWEPGGLRGETTIAADRLLSPDSAAPDAGEAGETRATVAAPRPWDWRAAARCASS